MAANEQQQKNAKQQHQEDRGECGREPAHHARRPMNAFLIFCKRHRTSVRSHFPNLENRAVTRVLGEWWATLYPDQKQSYINLAQEYKDAFLNANPDFKWYKLPAPPLRTLITRPTNKKQESGSLSSSSNDDQISELLGGSSSYGASSCSNSAKARTNDQSIQPGKLADESQIGGLSSLFTPEKNPHTRSEAIVLISSNSSSSGGGGGGGGGGVGIDRQVMMDHRSDDCNIPKPPKKRYTGGMPIQFEQKRECRAALFNNSSSCKRHSSESNNNEDEHQLNDEQEQQQQQQVSQTERTSYIIDNKTNAVSLLEEQTNYRGERSCKGLRYQKFLAEQQRSAVCAAAPPMTQQTKRPRLSDGISSSGDGLTEKTMNERRNSISSNVSEKTDSLSSEGGNSTRSDLEHLVDSAECRVEASRPEDTETAEGGEQDSKYLLLPRNSRKRFRAEDFNLEKKIEALPSLSLEEFQEKKKQQRTKKKNIQQQQQQQQETHMHPAKRGYTNSHHQSLHEKTQKNLLVGSQKRKARKQCITRNTLAIALKNRYSNNSGISTTSSNVPEGGEQRPWCASPDLEALACLAEMAANRTKLAK